MKHILFSALLAALFWTGCSKSGDDNSTPGDPQLNGTKWVVTYFWDKDKDETSDFNGYSFAFQDSGVLLAYLPDGTTRTGQWSVNNSSNKLIINITGAYALDEMTDDWLIMEKSDSAMKLRDDNTTHVEELHLKKI